MKGTVRNMKNPRPFQFSVRLGVAPVFSSLWREIGPLPRNTCPNRIVEDIERRT